MCIRDRAKYVSPTGFRLGSWINNMRFKVKKYGIEPVSYTHLGLCIGEVAFNFWTVVAFVLLAGVLYLLFRKDPNKATAKSTSFAASNV